MTDPLSLLRNYNVNKKEIVETGDLIIFGEYVWPKDIKTNFLIPQRKHSLCDSGSGGQAGTKEYYTLECLLFFIKNAALPHPEYVRKAAAENVPAVRRPDRKNVLAYLNGEIAPFQPASSSQTPASSIQTPASCLTPANSSQTPASSSQTPASSSQTPASSSQTPASSSQTPASSSQTPASSSQTPASSIQTPASSSQTPASSSQTPASSSQTPASSSQTPASSSQTPVGSYNFSDDGNSSSQRPVKTEDSGTEDEKPNFDGVEEERNWTKRRKYH